MSAYLLQWGYLRVSRICALFPQKKKKTTIATYSDHSTELTHYLFESEPNISSEISFGKYDLYHVVRGKKRSFFRDCTPQRFKYKYQWYIPFLIRQNGFFLWIWRRFCWYNKKNKLSFLVREGNRNENFLFHKWRLSVIFHHLLQ